MIAIAMLVFFVAIAGLVVACVAAVILVGLMSFDRHDPHAVAYGDIPFIPSAGVALRPDAGGCGNQPLGAAAARTRSAP